MKGRISVAVSALLIAAGVSAETLRVNNVVSAGAQYTSFEDAMNAAKDGDVIIIDPSEKSYGDLYITKKVTVKGSGYFIRENGISKEGEATSTCDDVHMGAAGAKITGMVVNKKIYMEADNLVVTRNYIVGGGISVCDDYSYTEDHINNGVIHQNFISMGIRGDNYSASAENMQVTNNIISGDGVASIGNMNNSVISRNTAIGNSPGTGWLKNCVIEYNIGVELQNTDGNNSISNNYDIGSYEAYRLYGGTSSRTDKSIKEVDATLATDKGAFSGEDPYILSGLPTGPYIQDIEMPESVVKGEDLKVTVKIGISK